MEELTGLKVKISFLTNSGVTLLSGYVIKANTIFVLLKTNLSIVYVPLHAIKLIQLVNEHEEN